MYTSQDKDTNNMYQSQSQNNNTNNNYNSNYNSQDNNNQYKSGEESENLSSYAPSERTKSKILYNILVYFKNNFPSQNQNLNVSSNSLDVSR